MSQQQVDDLVQYLALVAANNGNEPLSLAEFHAPSYVAGYREAMRSLSAELICRLREVKAESVGTVTRIGGDVA